MVRNLYCWIMDFGSSACITIYLSCPFFFFFHQCIKVMFASVSDTRFYCQCIPLLSRFGNTWLFYIFHMHTRMALILRAGARARWQILHCLQTQTSPSVSPDNAYEVDFTLSRLISSIETRCLSLRRETRAHTRACKHANTCIHSSVYSLQLHIVCTFAQHMCTQKRQ